MERPQNSPARALTLSVVRQVDEVADAFERALESGTPPVINEWLSRVPDVGRAKLLEELLALLAERAGGVSLDEIVRANPEHASRIAELADEADATVDLPERISAVGIAGRGLRVRCPHCHNPMELVPDAELDSIRCSGCGSDFSLAGDSAATRASAPVTELGNFRLVERVGIGAFGSVWKALDKTLDRTVAVKVPRKGQFDEAQERAFLREAQNAAQLSHPGIVPVYEVGREGDTLYIVSEFVRGLTLADWLTGQQLTPVEVATLCEKVGRALHHAHERGVVHRDLKPGNIMGDERGEPRLMDFGLARRDAAEVTMTIDGQVLGTPAYMSPEQAQGQAHTADRRSDVYSLGVVLFQLLTGELPFRGNTRMLLHQVIHDEAPSPRKLNASVPRDLETIALKCLEKDPRRRYASAGEVAEDLYRWRHNQPIQARPASLATKTWKWSQRNYVPAASFLVVILSLTAGALVATFAAMAQHREAARARQAEAVAEQERDAAARERDKTQRLINLQAAEYALEKNDLAEAMARLEQAADEGGGWENGAFYSRVVNRARAYSHPALAVGVDEAPVAAVLCVPKSASALKQRQGWLVLAYPDRLVSHRLLDGREEASSRLGEPVTALSACAPRAPGDRVSFAALSAEGRVSVRDAATLQERCVSPDGVVVRAIAPAAKASRLLLVADAKDTVVMDTTNGQTVASHRFEGLDRIASQAISPSGEVVIVGSLDIQTPPRMWSVQSDRVTPVSVRAQRYSFIDNERILCKENYVSTGESGVWRVISTDEAWPLEQTGFLGAAIGPEAQLEAWPLPDGGYGALQLTPDLVKVRVLRHGGPLGASVRFESASMSISPRSLFPQVAAEGKRDRLRLMSLDASTGALVALAGDRVVVLAPNAALAAFASGQQEPTPSGLAGAAPSAPCEYWTACRVGDTIWTYLRGALERRVWSRGDSDLVLEDSRKISPPSDLLGAEKRLVKLAATTGDVRVWALWEGSQTFSQNERHTSRDLVVTIYEEGAALPPGHSDPAAWLHRFTPLEPDATASYRLSEHPRDGLRYLVQFCVDPSGQTLFVANDDVAAGYDAATGELRYRIEEVASWQRSPDASRVAGGSWREAQPVRVWDVASGRTLMTTESKGELVKMAFSGDGAKLCIGWKQGLVEVYDVEAGELLRSFRSTIAPTCILPGEKRYAGFAPTSGPVGDLVLADLSDGRGLATLSEKTHVLNDCQVNPEGDLLTVITKGSVRLIPRMTRETAVEKLQRVDPKALTDWLRGVAAQLDTNEQPGG